MLFVLMENVKMNLPMKMVGLMLMSSMYLSISTEDAKRSCTYMPLVGVTLDGQVIKKKLVIVFKGITPCWPPQYVA
jgi:hypothetical protein